MLGDGIVSGSRSGGLIAVPIITGVRHTRWVAPSFVRDSGVNVDEDIEACALQRVRDILDNANAASLVTVPKVFFHDSEAHVIIMEDAGENSETLKALLRRTGLPSGNLNQLCGDLGRFLATIHNRGSEDAALMEKVNQNEEMRRITAWITYERVLPILRGEGDFKDLLSPSLIGPEGLSENDLARLEELCSQRTAEIHAAKDVFTMGDFWTGNVICRVNRVSGIVEKAFVVDWEVTKPGVPFLDFGQLAAELYTIGCFHSERLKEIEVGLKEYGRAYAEWREQQVDEAFVRGAGSHVGAHLAVITPTVDGWGTKDQVRGVVEEGTKFLLKGIEGDMVWLRNSAVGGVTQISLHLASIIKAGNYFESRLLVAPPTATEYAGSNTSRRVPILSLPPEMITEIFLHIVPPYPERTPIPDKDSPGIALATPTLWAGFSVTLHRKDSLQHKLELMKLSIVRSGSHPLSISLQSKKNLQLLASFLELISAHIARCEHIAFCFPLHYLSQLEGQPNSLKTLAIHSPSWQVLYPHYDLHINSTTGVSYFDLRPTLTTLFRNAPALHNIHIRFYVDAFEHLLPLSQLTVITLGCIDMYQLRTLLRHAAKLVHCTAVLQRTNYGHQNRIYLPNVSPITLSYLQTLSLRYDDSRVEDLQASIGVLTLPALVRLRISERNLSPNPIATLAALLQRSRCSLQQLCLNDASYIGDPEQEANMAEMLQRYKNAFPEVLSISVLIQGGEPVADQESFYDSDEFVGDYESEDSITEFSGSDEDL
ncbi:kinase-like domain-containing protein [Mycena amicta]|nr:kinase-like domain-containing protein [Mycena amicta]